MKISVITVCLNSINTIERTIKSVFSQNYNDIEYIVIDGLSDDGTCDILNKYKSKINYFISEKDEGIYHALNKGLKFVRGDIISILNSDDYYYSNNVLSLIAEEFKKDDSLKLVSGQMIKISNNSKLDIIEKCKNTKYSLFMSPFNHPTCFIRYDVYSKIGLFNTKYKTAADYDFLLRFLKSNLKYKCINQILINFSSHGVTSQKIFSPMKDIYKIHISNGYGNLISIFSLVYRFFRQLISYTLKKLLSFFI